MQRVALRPFRQTDIQGLIAYLNDSDVTRFITDAIARPYTEKDAVEWIEFSAGNELIKAIDFDGQFVGCISATPGKFEYAKSVELGYWIGRRHWQKGIATLALSAFCRQLFATTDIHRMFVSVVVDNTASIRVLEKNGFVQEGVLRQVSYKEGRFFDEKIMARCRNLHLSDELSKE